MGKKAIIISIAILLVIGLGLLEYYFHDEIEKYFREEKWIYSDPYVGKTIEIATEYEGGKNLFSVLDGNLNVYNNTLDNIYNENLNTQDIIFKSKDKYTIIASAEKKFAKLFKKEAKIWDNTFDFDIKNVSVNKNGFVTISFVKIGVKSGVKLFSNEGQEIINIYLSSTYAVDTELSNDNTTLYVAEANLSGINATSLVKIVDVATEKYDEIKLNNDEIITDIEYTKNNILLVKTDKAIYSIDSLKQLSKLYSFDDNDVSYATIEDLKYPIVIERNDLVLRVIKNEDERFLYLPFKPYLYSADGGRIALYLNNEIWVINNNCDVIKKCVVENGIVNMQLFDNGKTLALIHNNKVELLGI